MSSGVGGDWTSEQPAPNVLTSAPDSATATSVLTRDPLTMPSRYVLATSRPTRRARRRRRRREPATPRVRAADPAETPRRWTRGGRGARRAGRSGVAASGGTGQRSVRGAARGPRCRDQRRCPRPDPITTVRKARIVTPSATLSGGSQGRPSRSARHSCAEATGSKPAERKARRARALPGAHAATTTSPSGTSVSAARTMSPPVWSLRRVGLEADLGQPAQPRREGHERVVLGGGVPERRDVAAHDVACSARGWLRRSLRGTRRGSPPVPRATRTMSRESIQPLPARRATRRGLRRRRSRRDPALKRAVRDVVVDGEVGVAREGDDALDAGPPGLDPLPGAVDGGEVPARGLAEDFGDGVHGVHQKDGAGPLRSLSRGRPSGSTCWHADG